MSVATRRLPGFAFEHRAPVHDDVLPRMDVAVFAGFAARGPVNVPVPVEDAAHFAEVFGGEAPLAWDADAGRPLYAQLGPAVRLFFANGGRRCWVLRCAGVPSSSTFSLPGVLSAAPGGHVLPLTLVARSPGSWADGVAVATSLSSSRFSLADDVTAGELFVVAPPQETLRPGDLLRVTWHDAGVELYAAVRTAGADAASPPRGRGAIAVRTADTAWFERGYTPGERAGTARIADRDVPARFVPEPSPGGVSALATIALETAGAPPRPGDVIVATFASRTLLLCVQDTRPPDTWPAAVEGSPAGDVIIVTGIGLWRRQTAAIPPGAPTLERLTLDVWARDPERGLLRVGGLGLAPDHPRHVCALPDDGAVYAGGAEREVWQDVLSPRFPLAGPGTAPLCIPFGVGAVPRHYLPARHSSASALERDGLVPFEAGLFGDAALAGSRATTLVADAEYERALAPSAPRELAGVHRALALDEATVIAVPDAAQPGWERSVPPELLTPADTLAPVEADCIADDFTGCDAPREPAPVFTVAEADGGDVVLHWSSAHDGPFVVEQATRHAWNDAAAVFDGEARSLTLPRPPGDYYYRIRRLGDRPSDWSAGVVVRVTGADEWRACRADEYDATVVVAVHRMLLRVCAARRDVMAVLSLPQHYREQDAVLHVRELTAAAGPALAFGRSVIEPLGGTERDAPGFAALYHGWVYTRDQGLVRAAAPDGAVCGVIARRALARGAWVAPANEPLNGVIALEHPAPAAEWLPLQQSQINVLRQEPRGFLLMSADTLAADADVRPINVRRLLILLRRVATRLGARYAFEPNNAAFRRSVQRGFDALLGTLFERGAFAGSRAETAFQVATGDTLNTPSSVDAGRFFVELRVAPSRPMTFLTVRLVRGGDGIVVEGGPA